MIKNTQKTALKIWIFSASVFLFMILYGYTNFRISSFDGALIMVGITLFLTSLVFIRVTYRNSKLIDRALKRKELVVHWKYTKKEWEDYIEHEYNYRSGEKQLIAIFLSAFTILIFGLFILFIPEGKLAMFFVMLGLIAMYAFLGYILPPLLHMIRKQKGEVIILTKGVLLNKTFHTWDMLLSKLGKVTIEQNPYHHISLTYKFVDRTGPRQYTIHIPIPKSNKKDLKEIISQLK